MSAGHYSTPEDADASHRIGQELCPVGSYCVGGVRVLCTSGRYVEACARARVCVCVWLRVCVAACGCGCVSHSLCARMRAFGRPWCVRGKCVDAEAHAAGEFGKTNVHNPHIRRHCAVD